MWNLLAGYVGLVSIGCRPTLASTLYGLYWLSDGAGLDPFAAIPLAPLAAVIAVLVFRLRDATSHWDLGHPYCQSHTLRAATASIIGD
jgi:hypothetical protein